MKNAFLVLLLSVLFVAETSAQQEYKITGVDSIYSNLYLKVDDAGVEVGFATPDTERVKKHSSNTYGLFIYRSYQLSDNGTVDAKDIAMVSNGSVEGVIGINDYALKKGFKRTASFALPHTYKDLIVDGKGIVSDKPPYTLKRVDNRYEHERKSKIEKNEIPALNEDGDNMWRKRNEFHSKTIHSDKVLGVFGLQAKKDKTKKWNDLREFKFMLFNEKGEILNEVKQTYDRAYLPDNIGWVHNMKGEITGYFIGFSEAGGMGAYKKVNEEWAPQNKRVTILDLDGNLISSDIYKIPYSLNTFMNQLLTVLSVIDKGNGEHKVIFTLPPLLKQKIKEGYVSFEKKGDQISEPTTVSITDIGKPETKEKRPNGESNPLKYFELGVPLADGGLMLVGSPDGGLVGFLRLDSEGNVVERDFRYFAQPFLSKESTVLVKEQISDSKVLITAKIGNHIRSFSQYAIINTDGSFEVLRTSEDVSFGYTTRVGNKIIFYGYSDKSNKVVLARIDEL